MRIGVQFPDGAKMFLFITVSILAVRPPQPPTLHAPQVICPAMKQPRPDTDNSVVPSATAKSAWSFPSTFKANCLMKHRENYTDFTLN